MYFYHIGNKQKRPFSLVEIEDKTLANETLIQTEGMKNWKDSKEHQKQEKF